MKLCYHQPLTLVAAWREYARWVKLCQAKCPLRDDPGVVQSNAVYALTWIGERIWNQHTIVSVECDTSNGAVFLRYGDKRVSWRLQWIPDRPKVKERRLHKRGKKRDALGAPRRDSFGELCGAELDRLRQRSRIAMVLQHGFPDTWRLIMGFIP